MEQLVIWRKPYTREELKWLERIAIERLLQKRCQHCGLKEHKHIGPNQWCPRGQHLRRELSSFLPEREILEVANG